VLICRALCTAVVGCVYWLGPGWDVSSVSGCLLARLGPNWSTVLIDQPAGNHETTSLVGVACIQSFVVVQWVSPAHTLVCLQCNYNKTKQKSRCHSFLCQGLLKVRQDLGGRVCSLASVLLNAPHNILMHRLLCSVAAHQVPFHWTGTSQHSVQRQALQQQP
jgi:hypothetical protein